MPSGGNVTPQHLKGLTLGQVVEYPGLFRGLDNEMATELRLIEVNEDRYVFLLSYMGVELAVLAATVVNGAVSFEEV